MYYTVVYDWPIAPILRFICFGPLRARCNEVVGAYGEGAVKMAAVPST